MEILKIFLILFTIKINFILIMGKSCKIKITDDLPVSNSPLLLHTDLKKGFYYPNSDDGTIIIPTGESIVVACPGGSIHELTNIQEKTNTEENKKSGDKKEPEGRKKAEQNKKLERKKNTQEKSEETTMEILKLEYVRITCKDDVKSNLFTFKNTENTKRTVLLKNIRCSQPPKAEIIRTTNKCSNKAGVVGIIQFKVLENVYPIIEFCHDVAIDHTIYANSTILKIAKHSQKKVDRLNFTPGDFFGSIEVDNAYRYPGQVKTLTNILGSEASAKNYVWKGRDNHFFSRGHLVAKADLIFGSQQLATFAFVNAVPMWHSINGGNWAKVEGQVRDYATLYKTDLQVWTGSLGLLKKKTENGEVKQIWFYDDVVSAIGLKSIPVPELLFKVVYDSIGKTGVTFITINDPDLEENDLKKNSWVICKDVCNEMKWFKPTWNRKSFTEGYTYCCKVHDFRSKYEGFPQLHTGLIPLLKPQATTSFHH